jgi:hypothetical protein
MFQGQGVGMSTGEKGIPSTESTEQDPAPGATARSATSAGIVALVGALFLIAGAGGVVLAAGEMLRPGTLTSDPEARRGLMAALGIFGSIFLLVGAALAIGGTRSRRDLLHRAEAERTHPEEPWLWNPDWAGGRIRNGNAGAALGLFIFALVWNSFAWVMAAFTLPEALRKGDNGALAVLLFPAIGLLVAVMAISRLVQWMRFRRVVLHLEVPAVIGGRLSGRVETGVPLPAGTPVAVRVLCVHVTITGSGKNRSTHEDILWADERTLSPGEYSTGLNGSVLPVDLVIPSGLPQSSLEPSRSYHVWRLSAAAELAGPDLDALFEIPAFVTRDSRDSREGGKAAAEPRMTVTSREEAGPSVLVLGVDEQGRPQVVVKPSWTLVQNLGCLIFTAVLLFGAVAAVFFGLPARVPAAIVIIVAAAILMVVDNVFCSRRVLVTEAGVEVRGVFLGLFTRRIPIESGTTVEAISEAHSGPSSGQVMWSVEARREGARARTIAGGLRRKSDAVRLAAEINRLLGPKGDGR